MEASARSRCRMWCIAVTGGRNAAQEGRLYHVPDHGRDARTRLLRKQARTQSSATTGLTATSGGIEYDLPGGGCLALTNFTQEKPSASAGGTIAFEVEDLDALIAELKSKDVEFRSEVIHSPVCRMAVCLDSEGKTLFCYTS